MCHVVKRVYLSCRDLVHKQIAGLDLHAENLDYIYKVVII